MCWRNCFEKNSICESILFLFDKDSLVSDDDDDYLSIIIIIQKIRKLVKLVIIAVRSDFFLLQMMLFNTKSSKMQMLNKQTNKHQIIIIFCIMAKIQNRQTGKQKNLKSSLYNNK